MPRFFHREPCPVISFYAVKAEIAVHSNRAPVRGCTVSKWRWHPSGAYCFMSIDGLNVPREILSKAVARLGVTKSMIVGRSDGRGALVIMVDRADMPLGQRPAEENVSDVSLKGTSYVMPFARLLKQSIA